MGVCLLIAFGLLAAAGDALLQEQRGRSGPWWPRPFWLAVALLVLGALVQHFLL